MILLLGSTGTVGKFVTRALRARGVAYRATTRNPSAATADTVLFDWDVPSTYAAALAGIDVAFLLTPVTEQQVTYTRRFVEAATQTKLKRIVKLSVFGADDPKGILLQRLHGEGERVIQASSLAWTMLRSTAFMQNFVNHYGVDVTKESNIFLPHGTGRVPWIDLADVADVIATTLTGDGHVGKVYELTGPASLGDAEVAAIFSSALGRPYAYVNVPEEAARQGMLQMGMPAGTVEALIELHALIRRGGLDRVTSTVRTLLHRDARSFESFAREL